MAFSIKELLKSLQRDKYLEKKNLFLYTLYCCTQYSPPASDFEAGADEWGQACVGFFVGLCLLHSKHLPL